MLEPLIVIPVIATLVFIIAAIYVLVGIFEDKEGVPQEEPRQEKEDDVIMFANMEDMFLDWIKEKADKNNIDLKNCEITIRTGRINGLSILEHSTITVTKEYGKNEKA